MLVLLCLSWGFGTLYQAFRAGCCDDAIKQGYLRDFLRRRLLTLTSWLLVEAVDFHCCVFNLISHPPARGCSLCVVNVFWWFQPFLRWIICSFQLQLLSRVEGVERVRQLWFEPQPDWNILSPCSTVFQKYLDTHNRNCCIGISRSLWACPYVWELGRLPYECTATHNAPTTHGLVEHATGFINLILKSAFIVYHNVLLLLIITSFIF